MMESSRGNGDNLTRGDVSLLMGGCKHSAVRVKSHPGKPEGGDAGQRFAIHVHDTGAVIVLVVMNAQGFAIETILNQSICYMIVGLGYFLWQGV